MMNEDSHAHDAGLAQDLEMIQALNQQQTGRRRTLGLLFSAGGAASIGAAEPQG